SIIGKIANRMKRLIPLRLAGFPLFNFIDSAKEATTIITFINMEPPANQADRWVYSAKPATSSSVTTKAILLRSVLCTTTIDKLTRCPNSNQFTVADLRALGYRKNRADSKKASNRTVLIASFSFQKTRLNKTAPAVTKITFIRSLFIV